MIIKLTPIISRAKSKWYKPKKGKKLALNSQLLTVQILTNNVQVLILCLFYSITTVPYLNISKCTFPNLYNLQTKLLRNHKTLKLPKYRSLSWALLRCKCLGALQYKCKDIEQLYTTAGSCSLQNWGQNKSRNGFIHSDHSHIFCQF